MRKLSKVMIGLLLGATIAAPVAVQAQEQGRGRGGNAGWQRGGGDGAGGAQRGGGGERAGGGERGGWRGGGDRGAMMNGDARREAMQQAREARRQVERPAPVAQAQPSAGDARPQWRGDRGNGAGAGQDAQNRVERRRAMLDTNRDANRWNNRDGDRNRRDGDRDANRRNWDRDGNRNWTGERRDWGRDGNRNWSSDRRDWDRSDNRRWDRDWRNDRRYSWRDYRTHNRNIYRLPRYEARHGYSYQRWYPGYRWDSWLYSSSFWISDPWQYRLPPAYGPYRWVRYYDDVALVDTDTGEIVDIIYDFFW